MHASLSLSLSSMFLSAIATNLSFQQLGLVGWPQAAYKPHHTIPHGSLSERDAKASISQSATMLQGLHGTLV